MEPGLHAKIVDKATRDAGFRARLLSDPKGAIEQELNVTMSASLTIEVHESSATTAHLVLPPDGKLSESDLQTVAGGGGAADDLDEYKAKARAANAGASGSSSLA